VVDAGTLEDAQVIRIVNYKPQYATAFSDLNKEWIEKYFELEDEDIKVLSDPEGYVLSGGGEIFFALANRQENSEDDTSEIVGTVAMVKTKAGVFELAKMAVAPAAQGKGISRLLMTACIDFARAKNATEIFLVTNDILLPALGLYEKSGFVRFGLFCKRRVL